MKKIINIITTLLILVSIISCSNTKKENTTSDNTQQDTGLISTKVVENPISLKDTSLQGKELPQITFKEKNYDFGVLIEGEKVSHIFHFKNTGNSELVITKISTTCGCTVADYPTKPIPPGGEGKIEVVFNSAGKHGMQHKMIRILANTQPNLTELSIDAQVLSPEEINR